MKKILICLSLFAALSAAAASPPEVTEKVLKAFEQTFSKATDVVWHEMPNFYEARFMQSEMIVRAHYDKEGNLLQTTRYYQEDMLPINILTKLKKKYPGKSVYGVTELAVQDEVSYYITLQDDKNWYIVTSDSWGTMETTTKYKKA
jgi:hypothetical protein